MNMEEEDSQDLVHALQGEVAFFRRNSDILGNYISILEQENSELQSTMVEMEEEFIGKIKMTKELLMKNGLSEADFNEFIMEHVIDSGINHEKGQEE